MPTARYRHHCFWAGGREVETHGSRCWKCWREGEPYAWQWGVIEQWARFHKRTGLSPLHAKPPEVMAGQITRVCGRCNGHGFAGGTANRRIPICPDCDGAGGFPVLDQATLDYAREYAEAAKMAKFTEWKLRKAARQREEEELLAAARDRHRARYGESGRRDQPAPEEPQSIKGAAQTISTEGSFGRFTCRIGVKSPQNRWGGRTVWGVYRDDSGQAPADPFRSGCSGTFRWRSSRRLPGYCV